MEKDQSNPRVLVFGTGSIGIVYSMILSRSDVELSCNCRSNYTAVKENGFTVHSTIFGMHTFHEAFPSVQEALSSDDQNYDFIINSSTSVAARIAPLIFKHTAIVLIQHGIGIEQPFRDRYPENPNISCVAYLPTTQTAPGVVQHTEVERLQLGTFQASNESLSPSHEAAAATIVAKLKSGGTTVEIYPDIQVARWRKLIGNASWNTISSPLAVGMVRKVMEEVVTVAGAAGYESEIGPRDVEMQMDRSAKRSWPGVEPSMLADVREGRPMEVDAVVGEVVRLGREYGVEIPRLDYLPNLSE